MFGNVPPSPRPSLEMIEKATENIVRILNSHNIRRSEKENSNRPSSSLESNLNRSPIPSPELQPFDDLLRSSENFVRVSQRCLMNSVDEPRTSSVGCREDSAVMQTPSTTTTATAKAKIANIPETRTLWRSFGAETPLPQGPQLSPSPEPGSGFRTIFHSRSDTALKTSPAQRQRDHDYLRSIAPLPRADRSSSPARRSSRIDGGSTHPSSGARAAAAAAAALAPVGRGCTARPEADARPPRRRRLWERLAGCLGQAGPD